MSRQRLPFAPESLESLKGRYSGAISKLVDVESVGLGLAYDPGSFREHVFDTEDGIRLIISREDHAGEGRVIHFSASLDNSFPIELKKKAFKEGVGFITDMLEQRFREISGYTGEFGMAVTTTDGILHWFIFRVP